MKEAQCRVSGASAQIGGGYECRRESRGQPSSGLDRRCAGGESACPGCDVAVVGAGASAVAFLLALRQQAHAARCSLTVWVIDNTATMGTGRVYQEDIPTLLMNTPARALSLRPAHGDDFVNWLAADTGRSAELLDDVYVPRPVYGRYLESILHELAHSRGWPTVRTLHGHVADIAPGSCGRKHVSVSGVADLCADSVVLAVGPGDPADLYGLLGHDRYVPTPFPACRQLIGLPPAARILVLGTHLSAVDTALALEALGHRGPVLLASRRGLLPEVKSAYLQGPPAADVELCHRYHAVHGELPLRVLLRSYRSRLAARGIRWHEHLRPGTGDSPEVFEGKVQAARARHTSSIAADHGLDALLALLSESDMSHFMRTGYPMLLHRHTAMPLVNAEKLLLMLRGKRLAVTGGLQRVTPTRGGAFRCSFLARPEWIADIVVNATGAGRCVRGSDVRTPLPSLCARGWLREPATGGARVAPEGRVLNAHSQPVTGLYAVGHLTIGTHPFINNIELIRSLAGRVAQHVARSASAATPPAQEHS